MGKKMGRPPTYSDDAKVYLSATEGGCKLQKGSERRAIINALVDSGGVMTLAELDAKFGYIIREPVMALQRAKWLRIEEAGK